MARSGSAVGAKTSYCPYRRSYASFCINEDIFIFYLFFSTLPWNSLTVITFGQPSLNENLMMLTTHQCSSGSSVGAKTSYCPYGRQDASFYVGIDICVNNFFVVFNGIYV
jgi:hypothetical protein